MNRWCIPVTCWALGLLALTAFASAQNAPPLPEFFEGGRLSERIAEFRFDEGTGPGARGIVLAPRATAEPDSRPVHLIVFACPNGNSAEWTLGRAMAEGLDWHYDIQHIGAQWRALSATWAADEMLALAVLEADGKSWPGWRRKCGADGDALLVGLLEKLRDFFPGRKVSITLTGHSGGGSLTFGCLNAWGTIPSYVRRIAFLDSNYGFDAEVGHHTKLLAWLHEDARNSLVVVAYNDREIMLDGKKVVSETGGTWRATQRMIDAFATGGWPLEQSTEVEWLVDRSPQVVMWRHNNPENLILHTVMVGEMNGLMHAMTALDPDPARVVPLAKPRAYSDFVDNGELEAALVARRDAAAAIPPPIP